MIRREAMLVLFYALAGAALALAQAVPQRPAITGISHITFYADDLRASEVFYTGVLGFEQEPAVDRSTGVRFFANHDQFVELVPAPKPEMVDRLQSFGLNTSDAEALRRFLGAHGVVVPITVTVAKDGSRYFAVHDPENNEVEFVQPPLDGAPAPSDLSKRLSTHIIHVGFVAHDRSLLDHFYKDLLGCHLYWHGAAAPNRTDWVMMQVPDGTDWIEYMLYLPASPTREQLGGANHFSPGVESVADLNKKLLARGWKPKAHEQPPLLGLDGKWQLDLRDPDGTRVEFMEFKLARTPCCSSFTGPEPGPYPAW